MDDANRLDAYARTLSAATTRRATLRLLASGALGAVLLHFSPDEAAACVRAGKRLKHGHRCCLDAVRSGHRCICGSDDAAATCAGKCGSVQDNCGRTVSCGNTCS